jgi:hypothetical protein
MKRIKKVFIFTLSIIIFIIGFISGIYIGRKKGIPFVKRQLNWSIGIYTGKSPFSLFSTDTICNPVLTAEDVSDTQAEFVADPFIIMEGNKFFMFFEVYNNLTKQGDIALATSNYGLNWNYIQIILDEPFHLSYPFVFRWKDEYYLIPESSETFSIRLYKAIIFPKKWRFIKILLKGKDYVDPTIFYYDEKWWLFVGINSKKSNTLCLYHASELMGTWLEHSESPIIRGNSHKARPAGRILIFDNRIIRFAQECSFGNKKEVRAYEIDKLNINCYFEHEINESPVLKASGIGWNADGMHHIDHVQIEKGKWLACVDGYKSKFIFGWRY